MSPTEEIYFWGPGYVQNMPKVSCVTMDERNLTKRRTFCGILFLMLLSHSFVLWRIPRGSWAVPDAPAREQPFSECWVIQEPALQALFVSAACQSNKRERANVSDLVNDTTLRQHPS